MSDGIAITAGSGTTVATDDIASVHYQRVKVNYGADGSATDVDATHGLPVRPAACATATVTNVADTASSAQLLASTAGRLGCLLFNASLQTLYVLYGTTASIAAGGYSFAIEPGGYWEMPSPLYTGRIDGIWAANSAEYVQITELT